VTDAATVTVTIPARSSFIGLARVTAASLGAELDLDIDQLDDLRLALNELVAALIEVAEDDATIAVEYTLADDELSVSGRLSAGDGATLDDLSRQILGVVTDAYHLDGSTFALRKSRA
jgi:hypothetical protein